MSLIWEREREREITDDQNRRTFHHQNGRKFGIKLGGEVTEGLPNGNLQKGRVLGGRRRRDRSRIPDTMDKISSPGVFTSWAEDAVTLHWQSALTFLAEPNFGWETPHNVG